MSRSKRDRLCREIVLEIIRRCDGPDGCVKFEHDWGGGSITIADEHGHTHAGNPDDSLWHLVESIRDSLCGGPGLSWSASQKAGKPCD